MKGDDQRQKKGQKGCAKSITYSSRKFFSGHGGRNRGHPDCGPAPGFRVWLVEYGVCPASGAGVCIDDKKLNNNFLS
jgi:hypothetical protein